MRSTDARRRVSSNRQPPTLLWERRAWQDGKSIVAGVDEAGRGAWAGPLVAASVILPRDPYDRGRLTRAIQRVDGAVRDSKMLSADQRSRVMDVLLTLDVPFAISVIEVDHLDSIGLGAANRLALHRAVEGLSQAPHHVLVDAFRLSELPCSHEPIIRGDALSQSIALASIVAKVHRDSLMVALDVQHPEHGFKAHKGYGTAAHRHAIDTHGITPCHRRSFGPIAEYLKRASNN